MSLTIESHVEMGQLQELMKRIEVNLDDMPRGSISRMMESGRRPEITHAVSEHWDMRFSLKANEWAGMNSDGWTDWKADNGLSTDGMVATGKSLEILKSGGSGSGGYGRSWTTVTEPHMVSVQIPPDQLLDKNSGGRLAHTFRFWATYNYQFAGETDIPGNHPDTFPTDVHASPEARDIFGLEIGNPDMVNIISDVFTQAAEQQLFYRT